MLTSALWGLFLTQITGWKEVDCVILAADRIADLTGVRVGLVLGRNRDLEHTSVEFLWRWT